MSRLSKVMCVILSVLIVLNAVSGCLAYFVSNYTDDKNHAAVAGGSNPDNGVIFRDNVHIADDSDALQKKFRNAALDSTVYTLSYDTMPDFFQSLKANDVFCVYPDEDAKQTLFNLGFCGKVTDIDDTSISFTVPEITDVFSKLHIDTQTDNGASMMSTTFYPSEIVSDATYTPVQGAIEIGDSSGFRYHKPSGVSLLNDYTMVCDAMRLKVDHTFDTDSGFGVGVSGSVLLEDMAVKMLLDYQYNEATDTASINDYSLGFIADQTVDLGFSAEQTFGLDMLNSNWIEDISIIDIEDVTSKETGKLVLGTYVIGFEFPLPLLENTANKVSYLSFGVAIQLAVTASGTLSLEYNIEESGFVHMEVNSDGNNVCMVKGSEYPNPVVESREPTVEEIDSFPSVKCTMKGQATFNLAFGADIGLCILGMIPVKLSNNLIEADLTRSFSESYSTDDVDETKTADIFSNNYLLDDNVNFIKVSSNSFLKMHLGAKLNFGLLKYKLGEMGGSVQLFDKVWYQNPPAVGFTHDQCGFAGVFVGNTYTDEELEDAYMQYMDDTEQGGILTTIKDKMLAKLMNETLNSFDLGIDFEELSEYLGDDIISADDPMLNYKFNFYTSGVVFIRDPNNKVVVALVAGENVSNAAGIHPGLSTGKVDQVYSSADEFSEIYLQLGTLMKYLLDMDDFEDTNLTLMGYYSEHSHESMRMLFADDSLKLIIITTDF